MRRVGTLVLVVLLAALIACQGTAGGDGGGTPAVVPPGGSGCGTATAGGPPLASADPTFTHLGGFPFGVAAVRGYAFVADTQAGTLDVLADRDSTPHLIHRVSLPNQEALGVSLTADGRYLLIADGQDGAYVVDVALAERGSAHAVLGTLRQGPVHPGGAIEVAVSRDGRYAFVSREDTSQVAVYRLADAIADHFSKSAYVGSIPTGLAPVGLAVSPNGRWLYSTSEVGGPGHRGGGETGTLSVISVATAESDPAHAVVATVTAGCNPVRVAVSGSGNVVWVTARASDELFAFSAAKLRAHAHDPELAGVRVGEAPVGLALVEGGARVVVADSNRFGASGKQSGLTVVSTVAALAHRPAIVGTVNRGCSRGRWRWSPPERCCWSEISPPGRSSLCISSPRRRSRKPEARKPAAMSEVTAVRTLVKSAPELWALCSDVDQLAQHLEAFGEIRITRLEPQTTVAWEGDRASGTVRLEPSGWGTKVTVSADSTTACDAVLDSLGQAHHRPFSR